MRYVYESYHVSMQTSSGFFSSKIEWTTTLPNGKLLTGWNTILKWLGDNERDIIHIVAMPSSLPDSNLPLAYEFFCKYTGQ